MPDKLQSTEDQRVLKVLAASKEGGRHSPLFLWMMEHHATLAAEFAANGPQWATRATTMGEVGLVDAAGQKPTQRTVMQTWYRVCRALGATSPKKETPTPSASHKRQPLSPPTTDDPLAADDDVLLTAGDGTVVTPKKKSP